MSNFCEVVATETCVDKNGRNYKRVTLSKSQGSTTWTNPATGEIHPVLAPAKTVRTIGYEVPYLYDADDASAVSDYIWQAQTGMVIEGDIVRREVLPYTIDGETRTSATCFVQGNPNSAEFELAVKQAFERSGRTLLADAVVVPTTAEAYATARGVVLQD